MEAKNTVYDGIHVMNVSKHKTEYTYGPAQLSLKEDDFDRLLTYIENIRPAAEDENATENNMVVFLSWKGRALKQSHVSNIATRELNKARGCGKRASCTLVRKSTVTKILPMGLGSKNEQDLARLMKHSEVMQKRVQF